MFKSEQDILVGDSKSPHFYRKRSLNSPGVASSSESVPVEEIFSHKRRKLNENCSPLKQAVECAIMTAKSPGKKTPLKDMNREEAPCNSDIVNTDHFHLFDELDDQLAEFLHCEVDLTEPQHCKILEKNPNPTNIELKLITMKTKQVVTCFVAEFWSNCPLSPGNTVYIQATKTANKWVVNNKNGWIIYEPDFLISCTTVLNSLFCKRRSVFSEHYRGFEPINRHILIGVLVHTLLQEVLRDKLYSQVGIVGKVEAILKLQSTIRRIYESGENIDVVRSDLMEFVPKIFNFIQQFVVGKTALDSEGGNWRGKIDEIDDIEENLWCPELGLKGKIDISVKSGNCLMPLELKTGRASISVEHRGQVLLYIMILNNFGFKVNSGLLLYLREGVLKEIPMTDNEKRDILILRNELAYYLTRTVSKATKTIELPEPINHPSACSKCPYNKICTAYLRYNKDLSQHPTLEQVGRKVLANLTDADIEYFIKWSYMLHLEAQVKVESKNLREIYTVDAKDREKNGRCLIDLIVIGVGAETNGLYEHIFEKKTKSSLNFTTSGICESNYVVISTESRPAVASGFVSDVTATTITVTLDRNLNCKYPNGVFHVDTYDSSSIQSHNFTSLALLLENTPRSCDLRKVIVDKAPSMFSEKLPAMVAKRGVRILKRLNKVQQRAVLKAIAAKNYVLIKGMPGTGKSATIVALIQLLVDIDKSVLITSQTHSAIDNICLRLLKYNVDFLRLGAESRIHQDLKSKSEFNITNTCKTIEELQEIYNKYKVVAVTCLGSGHALLTHRQFDVCIVDESTQVLQSSIIRPLYSAKTFVLIGDPNQLSPVVRNQDAIKEGMAESLFERLDGKGESVVLNLNYRMNQTITDLINAVTYEGQLLVANETVAKATIQLKKSLENLFPSWIMQALSDKLEDAVQIIDTGPVWKLNNEKNSYVNKYEAKIVDKLIAAFHQVGVAYSDIGVLAAFRGQVAELTSLLSNTAVHVSTVDQFQGRDKSIIIYSCTKTKDMSNRDKDQLSFELLENQKRLTVAITRAKHKLIIIGDVSTLRHYEIFEKMFRFIQSRFVINLHNMQL